MQRPGPLAIVGPTASGKSRIAVEVCLLLPFAAEILSCDSMAVYRGLDVVSAKPTPDERAAVPHHLLDLVDASEEFTAAAYARAARAAAAEVRARGAVPVLVGGSGLYLRAALDPLDFAPTDPGVRARLDAAEPAELYSRLEAADPEAAERAGASNRRRLVRAVEILELTGAPPSSSRSSWSARTSATIAALTWKRSELYARVEERVDSMLASGLVEEVRSAWTRGLSRTARQAVGVKEVLDGGDVRTLLVRNTKRFVRRQYSWFRADPRVEWFDVSSLGWDAARDAIVRRFVEAAASVAGPTAT